MGGVNFYEKKAIISLLLILITMLGISGCGKKEKTSILTNDVKQQEATKDNEIKNLLKMELIFKFRKI